MNNSDKIKTGFIIALIAQIAIDTYFIFLVVEYGFHQAFLNDNLISMLIVLMTLVLAPFVLGLVALAFVKRAIPETRKDRTYRALAKIFANASIIESAVIFFTIISFTGLLIAIFS